MISKKVVLHDNNKQILLKFHHVKKLRRHYIPVHQVRH